MIKIRYAVLLLMLLAQSAVSLGQSGPPWTGSNFGFNYIFRGIDFPGDQNTIGFAAGESLTYNGNGIVLKTTDGGETWTQMWSGANRGIEGSCFVDTSTGYIAGWPKLGQGWSGFAKTADGGVTWTSVAVTNDIYFFTDVVFKDANNGILIGQTNLGAGVWMTTNGGDTWSPGTGLQGVPYHACYVSGSTYFLVDNAGNIQKSINNGLSWTTVFSQAGVILTGIDHYNDDIIMACGDNGVIVKSNDGGDNWQLQIVGYDIWHDFEWETADHVFVCGTPGLVYESTDAGLNWTNTYPQGAGGAALYECILTADDHGFICGSQGVLLQRNPSCGAGFSASANAPCTGDPVAFTDESWGTVTAWNWVFEAGTPSTSTEPNPVVVYNTPGTYDVTLTVSNPWWNNTLAMPNYIAVTQSPATPVITANGYTLSSNAAGGNQWYLDGQAISGATGQTYEAVASGLYWVVISQGNCNSDTSNNIYLVMTAVPDLVGNGLTIAPVPNHGQFTISYPQKPVSSFTVEVYNTLGIRIYLNPASDLGGYDVRTVDLGNVAGGLYTVVVTGNSGRVVRSIVVTR